MALAAVSHIVCTSMGVRCGAVIVDHGLQEGSEQVAGEAANRCRALGPGPVIVRNATVQARGEGLEAAARQARYNELSPRRVNQVPLPCCWPTLWTIRRKPY